MTVLIIFSIFCKTKEVILSEKLQDQANSRDVYNVKEQIDFIQRLISMVEGRERIPHSDLFSLSSGSINSHSSFRSFQILHFVPKEKIYTITFSY